MSFASATVKKIQNILYNPRLEEEENGISGGIKECNKAARAINAALKKAVSLGEKQHLTAALGQVKSFRKMFNALQVVGSGYKGTKETAKRRVHWEDSTSAFASRIRMGVITNLRHSEPKFFLEDCEALFRRLIQNALKKEQALKVNAVFCGEFIKARADDIIEELKFLNTKNAPIYRDTNLKQWFMDNIQRVILTELEEFQERDSGWALGAILNLQVNVNQYTPQLGSSYIELPKQIARKEACINIKNDDEACFAWSVVSALYPIGWGNHPDRMSSYPHYSTVLNLAGIQFPMTLKQIPRFEKQNKISVNVYILSKTKNNHFKVLPTYLTKNKLEKHVNLLMIQNEYYEEDDEGVEEENTAFQPNRYHYVWIKNLSRLLSSQLSKRDGKKYFCDRCLHYFRTQSGLDKHVEDCAKLNDCKIRLPTEDQKMLAFKNFKNKEKAPFIMYADLECVLKPVEEGGKYQEHIPCSIGYYVKCSYDESLSFYKSYRGPDSMEWFSKELVDFAEDLETVFLCPLPMETLTPDQNCEYDAATNCHICEKPFSPEDKKVRDHCHLTARYRGAAHEKCNLNFQDSHVVPVVFHNLSGYDAHFIIKDIAVGVDGRVELLPITKEKYISFTKNITQNLIKFRFIDSFRFMASSLDTLTSYLEEHLILKSEFLDINDEQFNLLKKKGVFPYDYIDSFEKFSETQLPCRKDFYNKLEEKNISRDQYVHAQNVWAKFNIQTLGDYSDLYLKTDVMLLAEVFEQFRRSCLEHYGLDPAHYYTLPGYTWDCMLKYTNINLELLDDIDMIMFIERGIRGGLSQCSKRRSRANNKYMPDYDSSKPNTYLMYFDINNQYGWAMEQYLPSGGFHWVENCENFNVADIPNEADEGYILEVDLEYPEHLHDQHKDIPFCPEHVSPPGSKGQKLLATLNNKTRYVIHYRNLKQALAHGLKLTKIHRILAFDQSPWLRSYISLNTKLRTNAKNEFEKNLFKLMNNAVFGKTMENIRKHSNVKLVTKWEGRYGAEALISKPEFKSSTIFSENLAAIELNKTEIYFNKPIYVGMCILDLAKTTIYDFHYDYMANEFRDNCSITYTDTDSLIYEINCDDVYDIIRRDCHKYFDTSDYPLDNRYDIPRVNKKVLGLMKDENSGMIMTDFVGLRSKMYTFKLLKTQEDEENERKALLRKGVEDGDIDIALSNIGLVKKVKGVKKSVVKNRITFDDYIECLDNFIEKSVNQNLIQSSSHQVHSITQTKISLNPHDDKRCILRGSYKTLPWGHYSAMET